MSTQTEQQVMSDVIPEVQETKVDPMVEQLNSMASLLEVLNKTSKSLTNEMKNLTKDINKLRVSKKPKVKREVDPNVPRKISALEKPVEITSELSEFLGLEVGEHQSRQFITQQINKYVKNNNIQNPENRRYILLDTCDEGKKLGELLRNPDQPLTFFNIQRYLKVHYVQQEKPEKPEKPETTKSKKVIDTTEHTQIKDEAVKDEAVKDEAVKDEAVKEEAVKEEAVKEAPKKKVVRRVLKKAPA